MKRKKHLAFCVRFITIILLATTLLASCEDNSALPSEIINSQDSFVLSVEYVGDIPRIDGFRIMQGGCVTENYAYFAMLDEKNADSYILSSCYIVKFDLETMQEVHRSEILSLGHANDITYIPSTNELYVVHCVNQKVSILDADTLTVKDSRRLQLMDAYAISYNEATDSFVTGVATAGMGFFSKDLKVTGSAEEINSSLITQGICSDDKYVYHILFSYKNEAEPQHILLVRDWDGNVITKIPFDQMDCEPENISLVGDTFYIGVNNSTYTGGILYAAKIVEVG